MHKIEGHLPLKIVSFITNLKNYSCQKILMSRHGQSLYNLKDQIGGDPELSESG